MIATMHQRTMGLGTSYHSTGDHRVKWLLPAILVAIIGLSVPASAQDGIKTKGDAALGEKVFKKCKACHKIGAKAKNSTGPVLNNIIGRSAASYDGFKYSKAMKAAKAKGLVWDEQLIFDYIVNPKKFLRKYLGDKKAKAKMKFKLKKEADRENVIAFLASISIPSTPVIKEAKSNSTDRLVAQHQAAQDQICIQNNSSTTLLLTVEAGNGERQIKTLGNSGVLCIDSPEGSSGSVGVFENEDALEGCSRLAKAGKTQVLVDYASYDNCKWAD